VSAENDPCEECRERAQVAARAELATSLAITSLAALTLVVLALIRAGVLSPADLLPVPRG
jgi:hypothetical protein